jgi:colanic acid/amylovoran biosynthesis glycosyltransferase
MKLLYLVSEYPKVSHSFVRREIEAVEALGHEVTRVSVRGWDLPLVDPGDIRERTQTAYILQGGPLPLLMALLWCMLTHPAGLWRALRLAWHMAGKADKPLPFHIIYLLEACWVARHFRHQQLDHVHAHFGTNPAEVASLLSALTAKPCSFTLHGPDEYDRPQALHLGDKVAASTFVATVSSFGRSQLLRWTAHEDWHKVKVVHCGLDATFLADAITPVPDVPRLVCVGRLSGQKGQLLLIEAAARLQREGLAFELVLAGDGEMRPQIEQYIAKEGLGQHVRITGWISGAQVKQELLAARALVLPSFAEGLPVVIMEAMALGRPVISTYIAGIPELVLDGQCGWLTPAGDVAALATAMRSCLACDTATLQAMGQQARERAAARHDIRTEAAKLAGLFAASAH